MNGDPFSSSPLITPERLTNDLEEALSNAPRWALSCVLVDNELPIEENAVIARVGHKKKLIRVIDPIAHAILCELTRFGNNVVTNTNGKHDEPDAKWYPKITFAAAAHDNMPVSRIFMDALQHEQVMMSDDPRDLRTAMLTKASGGKPSKASRSIAIGHAERTARKHAPEGFDIGAYLRNIQSLFDFHDQLFGREQRTNRSLSDKKLSAKI